MCSAREIRLRQEGFAKEEQAEWERQRWLAWMMLSPNYKQGRAPRTPQAFYRFPWEKATDEEILERWERSRVSQTEAAALNKLFKNVN